MTTIDSLIKRLEEGEGALTVDFFREIMSACGLVAIGSEARAEAMHFALVDAWLDACRALQAEVLPNFGRTVADDAMQKPHQYVVLVFQTDRRVRLIYRGVHGSSEERAWLTAILRAKEAENG